MPTATAKTLPLLIPPLSGAHYAQYAGSPRKKPKKQNLKVKMKKKLSKHSEKSRLLVSQYWQCAFRPEISNSSGFPGGDNIQMDIATFRLNWPKGWLSETF